jgi:hypothetical protein
MNDKKIPIMQKRPVIMQLKPTLLNKMALTDCVNELVLYRNGTLGFPALCSDLINTNSTGPSSF